jgi:hypothetical protein
MLVLFWFLFIVLSHGLSLTTLVEIAVCFTILITLIMVWIWELAGGIMFIVWGIVYIILVIGKFPLIGYLVVSGPLFLLGILFILDYYLDK